jgi:hypothetical protein
MASKPRSVKVPNPANTAGEKAADEEKAFELEEILLKVLTTIKGQRRKLFNESL